MNKTRIGTAILLAGLVALALVLAGRFAAIFAEPLYPISRSIQYSFTLENRTDRLLKQAEFWSYAPVRESPTQRCMKVESSHPHELLVDELGNQVLHFTLKNLPPLARRIILIRADLFLADAPNPMSMRDLQPFLRPERFVESESPDIAQLARKLRSGEPLRTAEKVFQWVSSNVQYAGYLKNERGALYAIREKKGDCTEFMDLFAALCRANTIPVRRIGGYVCSENAVLTPSEYHNWAEFYDGAFWRIADPQRKVFMKGASRYVAMEIMGESSKNPMGNNHRFRVFGDGLTVKMNG